MTADFYQKFEEIHRGSRELIKTRQKIYLPFIQPLKSIYEDCRVIDLGCGRGEWLELLKESGFAAQGVDQDEGMLSACNSLGLHAKKGDIISFLKSLPDESQAVISGFHIVEHLHFSDLQTLVSEAFRLLKPAGLLILETPNPENILVGATNFHLDPTHYHPLPPGLLSFLPQYYGFSRVKIIRLQESPDLITKRDPSLLDVLGGVSPDYSVVAQKHAPHELLSDFTGVFEKEYGITLETLAERFNTRSKADTRKIDDLVKSMEDTVQKFDSLTVRLDEMYADRERDQIRLDLLNARSELLKVYNCRSYRITAPLRFIFGTGRVWKEKINRFPTAINTFLHKISPLKTLPKRAARKSILFSISHIGHHARINLFVRNSIAHFPGLKLRMRDIISQSTMPDQLTSGNENNNLRFPVNREIQRIYWDLVNNINRDSGLEQ